MEVNWTRYKYCFVAGLPDDGEFQYFLAIAELQKNIEELKVLKVMSDKNLEFVQEQLQRKLSLRSPRIAVKKIRSLFPVNENLSVELEERRDDYKQRKLDENCDPNKKASSAKESSSLAREIRDADQRIRATKLAYTEFKRFLGEFLPKVAPHPTEGSRLARLLQSLWNVFSAEGVQGYLDLGEGDVGAETDVVMLLENGVVERDPKNKDRIRLVDFTQAY